MGRTELQSRILKEMKRLGWSHAEFVKEYDKHHKYKSGLTESSLKKQLSRNTTRPELLNSYLDFIYNHSASLAGDMANPPNYSEQHFNEAFNKKMESISKQITDDMENDL